MSPTLSHPTTRRRRSVAALAIALGLVLAGCSSDPTNDAASGDGDATPVAYAGYASDVYDDPASWLCRPDADDVCDEDLDTEVVTADGTRTPEPFQPADDPGIDCFYVYPTVSADPGANSDLVPDGGEATAARSQVARLAGSCRVWAPMYRQATLGQIAARVASTTSATSTPTTSGEGAPVTEPSATSTPTTSGEGAPVTEPSPAEVAYTTALDAFRHYMANDNDGRGVVLVGHSQGTGVLRRLISEEIDADPILRERLVGAYLLGLSIPEDPDADAFANIPVCTEEGQVRCYVSWSSYRATEPPGANGIFGRPTANGGRSACTNPGDLPGTEGRVPLTPYFEVNQAPAGGWLPDGPPVTTPWVALPGLVEAECVERDGYHYLEITVVPDDRAQDIPGDLLPGWGLHLVDANLATGELVDLVAAQAAAWGNAGS